MDYFLGGAQRAPKVEFKRVLGTLLGALLGVPFGMLEGLWLFLGIVRVQSGARSVKMTGAGAILAQVDVARGSLRLSMHCF